MMCRGAAGQAASGGSISVNADEVLVDLLVHDGKGRPVLDLTPQQLTVTDDGSEVKLKNLRLVQDDRESGHEVTLVFGRLDAAGDKNARVVARKILDALPKGFSYSVMNIGTRLRLLQMFTTDRAQIDKGVEMATIQELPGELVQPSAGTEKNLISVAQTGADVAGNSVAAKERAMAKVVLASLEESQQIVQDQNSQATLAGLLALARNERDLSGRRAIIFFTEGLQMDVNAADMIRSVVGAANRAGVTIYAVDLSPLDEQATSNMIAAAVMAPQVGPARVAASAPAVQGVVSLPRGMLHQIAEQTQRMETEDMQGADSPLAGLSTGTGGAYILANSSMKRPLKQMSEDMTTYYEASFVPSISDYNGSFRPVHVTTVRKGLVLRYRAGYFAISPDAVSKVRPFEEPLLKILAGATLPEDLRFHVGMFRMGTLQDGDTNTLVIETPLKELEVREDSNTKLYSLHVTMVAQIRNKDGVVIDHFSQDLPQHGAISSLQWADAQTVTMQRHFIAPPGAYVLEAAVVDQNSGKVGAQKANFVVPTHTHRLGLSDMVLVRRMDMLGPEGDPMEPLRYGKAKVIANASGQADIEAKSVSVFFMIHPGAGGAPVKLEMEVAKEGRVVGKIPLPVRSDAGEGTVIPYLASIQTRWLSVGHYEIAALVTQGESSEKQTIDFTIVGPSVEVAALTERDGASGVGEPASESRLPDIGAAGASKLTITSLANPLPAPTPEESEAMLSQTRGWALHYAESLPNFLCVEVTTRSVDPKGTGDWRQKDEMAQLLKYRDNSESRTMLEANGKRSKEVPDVFKQVSTRGQFGGVLNAVFQPSAKAEFHWKETDMLGMGRAQVFSYEVKAENSSYGLTGSDNSQMNVAFHGLVYIDAATMGVRRITMEAEGIPRSFSIQASAMAVDYDYIVINRHDYLMPIHAAVTVRQGRREDVLNEIEFRDYKRFGSRVKILDYAQVPAQ
jgi:VWFA-related protein